MPMSHRYFAIAAWLTLAFITFATLSPIGLRPELTDQTLEHLGGFFVLAFLFGTAYPRHFVAVTTLLLASALSLELLQLLTPDRHARLIDATTKLAGGFIGLIAARIAATVLPFDGRSQLGGCKGNDG